MRPHARFGRVLAAESVSNFGSLLSRLAIPWLAVLALQATPAQMALLLVADVLAGTLGALLLAPWIDRHGKRAAMLLADLGRLLLMALLALAAWQGRASLALLVAVAMANGALGMVFELARSAWTAHHVDEAALPRRNAQLSLAGSVSETAAFAAGGWIYQGLGAAVAFAVDAASYALSALCLRGVPEAPAAAGAAAVATPAPAAAAAGPARRRWDAFVGETAAGWRVVRADPRLRALAGIEMLGSLSFALTGTVYTIYVTRDLGVATGPAGVIAACGGAGAALGALLAPRLGRRWGSGWTMALGLGLLALGTACLPLASAGAAGGAAAASAGVIGWLVAHQVVGDGGHVLHDVHDRTLRQTAVAPAWRARADAGLRAAGQLALLAGAVAGGLLGNAAGSRVVLGLAAAAALGAAAIAASRLTGPPAGGTAG